MTTIQERLQMKRVPLDTWSTQEKLCLASSVVRSGDQNWMSVSRALKTLGDPSRPADWFSQKNCAAQYGSLLENVETPRRKKRASEGATETPQESIVKKLTQQRVQELQKEMVEVAKAFVKIKDEVKELMSDNISEARIRELNAALEATKREKERNAARRAQWLKEREQRRGLLEKAWRRAEGAILGDTSPGGAAPLLTSLLQQSPGSHLMAELLSPSSSSSTLTHLLEKSPTPVAATATMDEPPMLQPISSPQNKTAAVSKTELMKIEQIKSELQEIEQQYCVNSMPQVSTPDLTPMPPLTPVTHQVTEITGAKETSPAEVIKTPEKIDIDDIEIKAEDVYAFSDVVLEIQPVSSIHKSLSRSYSKKDTSSIVANLEEVASPAVSESTEVINSLLSPINVNENNQVDITDVPTTDTQMQVEQEEPAAHTEVVVKEEVETEPQSPATETVEPQPMEVDEPNVPQTPKEENVSDVVPEEQTKKVEEEESSSDMEMNQKVSDIKKDIDARKSNENIVDSISPAETDLQSDKVDDTNIPNEEPEKMETPQTENKDQTTVSESPSTEHPAADVHNETDDDAPIELIKEDKPGKKRDYSRKKQEKDEPVSSPVEIEGTLSNKSEYSDEVGSDNSQGSSDKKMQISRFKNEDSLPGSPAPPTPPSTITPASPAPEQDREYKSWKKAIILALSRLNTLRCASLYQRPITDDEAPKYSLTVKKPMDLTTIRKNIDNGVIRTTKEFQHSVLLMMNNALMYNPSNDTIYSMTKDTLAEVQTQLDILLQAQGHATLSTPLSRQARPAYNLTRSAPPSSRRKRGGGDTPTLG